MAVYLVDFSTCRHSCPPPRLTDRVGGILLQITNPSTRTPPVTQTGPTGRRAERLNPLGKPLPWNGYLLTQLPWNYFHSTPFPFVTTPLECPPFTKSTLYQIHPLPNPPFTRPTLCQTRMACYGTAYPGMAYPDDNPLEGNWIEESFQGSHSQGNVPNGRQPEGLQLEGVTLYMYGDVSCMRMLHELGGGLIH